MEGADDDDEREWDEESMWLFHLVSCDISKDCCVHSKRERGDNEIQVWQN